MTSFKLKIKKGDTVKVLSGKDKGKTGKVIRVLPKDALAVVENVNVHTRFERAKRAGEKGTKVQFSAPLPVSKLQVLDSSGKPTRVGFKVEAGEKLRIAKANGKAI